MHPASGGEDGACHDVVLSTDVEASTPKDHALHNLYVLDRDLVAKCADTPPRQNHHAPYCRDALELLDIMDELDRDRTQQIDEDTDAADIDAGDGDGNGNRPWSRSGDLTLYARTGLQMRKQIAYGYDPKDKELKLVVDALVDKRTGRFVDVRNTRTPLVVRFGDTLGMLCDLPLLGKTRIAAESASARDRAIAAASVDPFLNVMARSRTPPTGTAEAAVADAVDSAYADACHPLHLHSTPSPTSTAPKQSLPSSALAHPPAAADDGRQDL